MKITIKHYSCFANSIGNNLLTSKSWDALRVDEADTPFSLPKDRNKFINKAINNKEYIKRANKIIEIAESMNIKKIFSVGVGCAHLEYNIKNNAKDIHLVCSDFTPLSIERLKKLFVECDEIKHFNILEDDFVTANDAIVLLHRVDTDLDDTQWKFVFKRMKDSKISNILIVATEFLTFKTLLVEGRAQIRRWLGSTITFAGYIRTQKAFISLWEPYYKIQKVLKIGSSLGFLLTIK